MAEKSKTHRKETTTNKGLPMTEMAEQARRNYQQALRTGQKLQEEAGEWWTRMFNQTTTAADWQRQFANFTSMTGRVMPLAQRRMEDALELMEKNSRVGAELMKKAIDAVQTPGLGECQAKWLEFWTCSMRAVQSNVEAATNMGTKTIDLWIDLVRKNADVTEARAARAA
jgi:hypothetical protein